MNQRNYDTFDKCIEFLKAGIPIEDCLKEYPDLGPEMKDILEMTREVMNLTGEQAPITGIERIRGKLLSQARLLTDREKHDHLSTRVRRIFERIGQGFQGSLQPLMGKFTLVLGITAVLLILSGGLVITSAKALPGDSLYPVKRAVEDIRIYLVPNSEVRHEYEDNYSKLRVEEVKRLLDLKRVVKISFEGVLEVQNNNDLKVSGIPVILQPDTTLVGGIETAGLIEIGSVVEVEGITSAEGWVTANEVHLREYEYSGIVEIMSATTWQISGIQLSITSITQIDEAIHLGDPVTVLIHSEDNGLYALAILRELSPTATPSLLQEHPISIDNTDDLVSMADEDHHLAGTLEEIGSSYWVVGGQVLYIGGIEDLPDDLQIGDTISLAYRIEGNGSLTVLEAEQTSDHDLLDSSQHEEVTDASHDADTESISSEVPDEHHDGDVITTPEPTGDHEAEPTTTPENYSSPEPTEIHETSEPSEAYETPVPTEVPEHTP